MAHHDTSYPPPIFLPHELGKISVTHCASIDKARNELGYAPGKSVAAAMRECLEYCEANLGPYWVPK